MSLIKKIRIKNFKSLEDVEIDVKQLNFLFGPNSSGKSSFLKAIMFLSKNMLPFNTGKTIYKISDEVDLGSYKDIVTNNDESRRIVFEFDMEGEFEFLKIAHFQKGEFQDIYGIIKEPEYKYLFKFFDDIGNPISSISSFSFEEDEIKKDSENVNNTRNYKEFKNEPDYPMENCKYYLTMTIEFSNIDPNYNFTRMAILDNIKKSSYKFVRKDKRPNEEYGESGMISGEEFKILNNLELSHELGLNFYIDDLTILFNDIDFLPEFNLSKVSKSFDKLGLLNSWGSLNKNDLNNFIFESIQFIYLSHKLVPDFLKTLLELKHLPTTREIPKKIYLLERNDFNPNEYYGLLSALSEEFYPIEFSGTDINFIIKNKTYNELFEVINSINNKTYIFPEFGQYLQYNYSINFNINNNLLKLGLNAFYTIEIDKDIGRIYLIGKNNMKMYMSNSSSGFIQIFPIIACCVLIKINPRHSNLEELNSIKDVKNKIPSYYYKSVIETDFHTLLIEQPELHLHPKLQSQLAEIFADTVNNANIFSSLFIETHSEHLIRKMQVLIAKGELDREKVGVWYFDNSEGTTKIKEMKIDENGLFKEDWPRGFFDDSVNLTMELFEALRKRKN